MWSPDGLVWTLASAAAAASWDAICWSPQLGMFCAVALGGNIMTSTNAINWTAQVTAAAQQWQGICWSPQLGMFCAVSNTGTNRVMTSRDGVNWKLQVSADSAQYFSVDWSPERGMFFALSDNGVGTSQMMYSYNGVKWWKPNAAISNITWRTVIWCPKLKKFSAISQTTSVMLA